jgi:hypothetical protein
VTTAYTDSASPGVSPGNSPLLFGATSNLLAPPPQQAPPPQHAPPGQASTTVVYHKTPKKGGKKELEGPCCHCGASQSPQWRKGPKGKPILCNACGIRFLRTRSLGKVRGARRRAAQPPAPPAAWRPILPAWCRPRAPAPPCRAARACTRSPPGAPLRPPPPLLHP